MGEKTSKNSPDSNFGALAEAIIYLADKIREGCADVADGLREMGLSGSLTRSLSNHMDNNLSRVSQGENHPEKTDNFILKAGADEIPDMRDDTPLSGFGRKAD
jgi:hypothetical protein